MPRRYYRSRVRYIKPKKRWASNIKNLTLSGPSSTQFCGSVALVSNTTQNTSPTPVIIKAKRFKVSVDCFNTFSASASVITPISANAYVIFVPEGYISDQIQTMTYAEANALVSQHPEYILSWRKLDFSSSYSTSSSSGSSNSTAVTFSSSLARNLNSGDRIFLIILAETNNNNVTIQVAASATVQYWTCAN